MHFGFSPLETSYGHADFWREHPKRHGTLVAMHFFRNVHAWTSQAVAVTTLFTSSISSASAFCFDFAASRYGVNESVLRAIASHESRLKPDTVTANSNGTQDIGLMGINTVHLSELAQYGIKREALLDPCSNVQVGAWLLKKKTVKWGNTWQAVGAYHSESPDHNGKYQRLVSEKLAATLGAGKSPKNVK